MQLKLEIQSRINYKIKLVNQEQCPLNINSPAAREIKRIAVQSRKRGIGT